MSYFKWIFYNSDQQNLSRYYSELQDIYGDKFTNQSTSYTDATKNAISFVKSNTRKLRMLRTSNEKNFGAAINPSEVFESYKEIKVKKTIKLKIKFL